MLLKGVGSKNTGEKTMKEFFPKKNFQVNLGHANSPSKKGKGTQEVSMIKFSPEPPQIRAGSGFGSHF